MTTTEVAKEDRKQEWKKGDVEVGRCNIPAQGLTRLIGYSYQ
jgi:hypothetical protein